MSPKAKPLEELVIEDRRWLVGKVLVGEEVIVDAETGEKKRIRKGHPEDLYLLSRKNMTARSKENASYLNQKLFGWYARTERRQQRRGGNSPVEELDAVLANPEVVKYLGARATYKTHAFSRTQIGRKAMSYEDTVEGIRKVLEGKAPIRFHGTGKDIYLHGLSELHVLTTSQVNNTNLAEAYKRITKSARQGRDMWSTLLSKLFLEEAVVDNLGGTATYDSHVVSRKSSLEDKKSKKQSEPKRRGIKAVPLTKIINKIRRVLQGAEPIYDRTTKTEKYVRSLADLRPFSSGGVQKSSVLSLYQRITKEARTGGLGWEETLDVLFKEQKTIDKLGGIATYRGNVLIRRLPRPGEPTHKRGSDLLRLKSNSKFSVALSYLEAFDLGIAFSLADKFDYKHEETAKRLSDFYRARAHLSLLREGRRDLIPYFVVRVIKGGIYEGFKEEEDITNDAPTRAYAQKFLKAEMSELGRHLVGDVKPQ